MLGAEETKHLAIAAVCGVAIGAAAGAIGYAAFSSRPTTPQPSRKNSCASCAERLTPQHRPGLPANSSVPFGDGDHGLPAGPETIKLLEELSKRMQSLEQAVRTKLLSKSGTNSSIGGYLTAPESPSASDDDEFQDVSGDSSNGDDIFFHTSASPKPAKSKSTSSIERTEQSPSLAEGASEDVSEIYSINTAVEREPLTVDFVEIDRYLCSDLMEENDKAHELLTSLRQSSALLDSNPQFLWRFAKSVHQKNLSSSDPEVKKVHAFHARELAFEALQAPGGDSIADVHKWCAITIGNIGDYVSLQEKISNGSTFKERIDAAIKLNNKDEMSFYLLGRWCYSIYMMSWVERKVASSMVSNFPSATIDESLVAFQNSEGLKPGYWIDNQLYLAKCYIEKRDYTAAITWLDSALTLDTKPEDDASKQEVESLINKYSGYRKS